MVELFSIKDLGINDRVVLLKELGYTSDGVFVIDGKGERVTDRYIDQPVRVDNMLIFPGSEIILDDNPLSVASYLEEFPNAF